MKKFKFFTALVSTTTILTTLTTLSSCSNSDDVWAKDIVKKAVEEFIEVAKIPRPTLFTGKIRDYIIKRITDLGYAPQTDYVDGEGYNQSANVWFDVPASVGYENCKKVIMQAHMDMVVAGVEKGKETETPIDVEYHENNHSLTSKNNKTSLGADNGIGIGLIFSLIQNKQFKHGPIRFLFTADEERGMLGAKRLDSNVLDSDYFICLDGELDYEGYYRSCQGSCGYTFRNQFTLENPSSVQTYDILIEGFTGGHSGQDINKGRCNATIFIMALLDLLNDDAGLIKYNYLNSEGKDISQNRNAIPSFGRVKFTSTKTEQEIRTAFNSLKNNCKNYFYGDDWDKIQITSLTKKTESISYLDNANTKKLIYLITNSKNNGFIYGPYIEDPQTKRPLLSCNISNLYFNNNNDGKFEVTTYARSVSSKGIDTMQYALLAMWHNYFDTIPEAEDIFNPTYPWEINDNDKIQKLADTAYRSIGITPVIKDSHGGIENAVFVGKRSTLNLTSLGTKFEGVHTINETCYLDPLVNTVKVIKYIVQNNK